MEVATSEDLIDLDAFVRVSPALVEVPPPCTTLVATFGQPPTLALANHHDTVS